MSKYKKKINSKGFSFVEILAVIAIIGILSSIAIVGYSRYKDKAQRDNVTALVYSTISAFDEYLLDHPYETTAFSSKLIEDDYLSNDTDPYNKEGTCTIRIEKINVAANVGSGTKLDTNDYKVYICCANRTKNYTYTKTSGSVDSSDLVVNVDGQCQAGFDIDKLYSDDFTGSLYDEPITSPDSSLKSKKNFNIYTMNELNKDCTNTAGRKTTYCLTSACTNDSTGRKTEVIHNPYRLYDYYAYKCTCYYKKSDGGYYGYNATNEPSDHHTMVVFYLNNANGKNACNSSDASMFNKYINHVCTWGVFLNGATQINFHGYQWYRGNDGSYGSFTPNGFWYHDYEPFEWKATKEPDESAKMGCAKTCLYMTPYWGGKSE